MKIWTAVVKELGVDVWGSYTVEYRSENIMLKLGNLTAVGRA